MQNAKDSFYEELRGRLAGLNPERTVVVRGVTRPGVVIDENEIANVANLPDCFHLRWTECAVHMEGALAEVALTCEISYATAGSAASGGLDRGRVLSGMDGELRSALETAPQAVVKRNFSALATGGVATGMASRAWWSDVSFGPVKVDRDRLTRLATVTVMSFAEEGEL